MPAPKSVIKLTKDSKGRTTVEYTSNVDAAQYYIFELNRAALRDVGKYVKRVFKENFYKIFKRDTGYAGKITKAQVLSSKKTQYPRVEIGLPSSYKGKDTPGYYAYFQEFGTSRDNAFGLQVPKHALLQHAVQDNIAEIVKIESQYLSHLEDEAERLNALINEGDYVDED